MGDKDRTEIRKMVAYANVSVAEYTDGRSTVLAWRMDMSTRRMIPTYLTDIEQPARDPFSVEEQLLMGALELYVQKHGEQLELPW